MKLNLYKTLCLVAAISLNFFFTSLLHASVPTIGEETSSGFDDRVSPDFDMDQSGNRLEKYDGVERWENEGKGSLKAASEAVSLTPVAEKEKSEPEVLKVEEAAKLEVEPVLKEKVAVTHDAEKNFQNEDGEKEDSLFDTDSAQPEL